MAAIVRSLMPGDGLDRNLEIMFVVCGGQEDEAWRGGYYDSDVTSPPGFCSLEAARHSFSSCLLAQRNACDTSLHQRSHYGQESKLNAEQKQAFRSHDPLWVSMGVEWNFEKVVSESSRERATSSVSIVRSQKI